MKSIRTYKEAFAYLRRSGTKAAIQSKFDGRFVYVQKNDLLSELNELDADGPTDYDGNPEEWRVEEGILFIHAGSF